MYGFYTHSSHTSSFRTLHFAANGLVGGRFDGVLSIWLCCTMFDLLQVRIDCQTNATLSELRNMFIGIYDKIYVQPSLNALN